MHVMNQILRPFIGKFLVVYFDNILIYTQVEDEHLSHLRQVLNTLRKEKFYINSKKCAFVQPKVVFLGLAVYVDGVSADSDKVKAIQEWPQP